MFSIKMRAGLCDQQNNVEQHISGAERIVDAAKLQAVTAALIDRALTHSKGTPDTINIKLERLDEHNIRHLPALPVSSPPSASPAEAALVLLNLLQSQGIANGREVMDFLPQAANMRGAILLDADSLQRLEPDLQRGVRATYMDACVNEAEQEICGKNHFREALVLATKVAHAPHIVGEICISDDPDYTTGYFASLTAGYVRLSNIKAVGSAYGGRIFLYQGPREAVRTTVDYLEKQCVLVDNVPPAAESPTVESPAVVPPGRTDIIDLAQSGRRADNRELALPDRSDMTSLALSEKTEAAGLNSSHRPGHVSGTSLNSGTSHGSGASLILGCGNCGSPSLVSETAAKDKWQRYAAEIADLKQKHLLRSLQTFQSEQGAHVICRGKDKLLLASSNYLGLIQNQEIKEYTLAVLQEFGAGSGGSRLTTGNTVLHEKLEEKLAQFKHTEKALVFNSGYVANLATISALCRKGDVIFSDELNHASIIDGCRLSKAEVVVYRHNDMADLAAKARSYRGKHGLIVSDAVFSMDGDIVRLPELLSVAEQYGYLSMIDEAHATGVLGETGRGITEYYHLKQKPDILLGTLSKALGSEGGFVCGSKLLLDYLQNKARGFIFSTSLAPVTMAASLKALEIIDEQPWLIKKLQSNTAWFCRCLRSEGMAVASSTPIIPLIIGEEQKTLQLAERLFEAGYFVSAIRYPTVARGSARLRLTVMATHTETELAAAAAVIGKLRRQVFNDK